MEHPVDRVVGAHDAEIADDALGEVELLPGATEKSGVVDDGHPVFVLVHGRLDFVRIRTIVFVPQQHTDAVDDALHPQLDHDADDGRFVDRVPREAAIQVVVGVVAVE